MWIAKNSLRDQVATHTDNSNTHIHTHTHTHTHTLTHTHTHTHTLFMIIHVTLFSYSQVNNILKHSYTQCTCT